MIDDITSLSLIEVAAEIAAKRLSSVEATRACLARFAEHGKRLNCVAGIDPDAALAAAATADAELGAGRRRGPLHGVPLAHKDMFYRTGRVSGCGSRIRADFVPDHTATVLARLDEAGALDLARLNMVEFALGPTGHNEITGTPCNPWNLDYITGGSSSGPAAAVAARLVYGTLGSDTGGSVRLPAACCGLVGMKPSYGRVSRYGSLGLSFTLDHPGPLARTVADCALLLRSIAGHDPHDATTSTRPVPDYLANLEQSVRSLRIAVPENYFYDPVTPEVRALMDESLAVFRALGAQVVPVTIPSIELANPMVTLIIGVEAAALHGRWLRERAHDYGKQTRSRLLAGLLYPATRYVDALNLRQKLLQDFSDAVFTRADLLHLPVIPMPIPTIAESDLAANPGAAAYILNFGHCTRPFNYLGLPAITVPAGFTANGLPCGMQLVGRPFAESVLLQAARAYERETDWTSRAPAL
jgi:aspartyl-tRNA(Asn)/glutamyl-tRNA(Gln) amidotransferase subunit A